MPQCRDARPSAGDISFEALADPRATDACPVEGAERLGLARLAETEMMEQCVVDSAQADVVLAAGRAREYAAKGGHWR
jgi:hypothetical protein